MYIYTDRNIKTITNSTKNNECKYKQLYAYVYILKTQQRNIYTNKLTNRNTTTKKKHQTVGNITQKQA